MERSVGPALNSIPGLPAAGPDTGVLSEDVHSDLSCHDPGDYLIPGPPIRDLRCVASRGVLDRPCGRRHIQWFIPI